jgi:uncharacterized protein YwgA
MAKFRRELVTLLFVGNRDQALLALVIQEAQQAALKYNGIVGRTAVQKTMYFLKMSGIEMNYTFDIYRYGPFCEIGRDIELLVADGVIQDRFDDQRKFSDYGAGEFIEELLSKHRVGLEPLRESIRSVIEVLIPLDTRKLELVATLDYLFRQQRATAYEGTLMDRVISRFQEIKGERFPLEELSQTYLAGVTVGVWHE